MNVFEIIVLIVVCVAFVCAVTAIVYGKIKHKGTCCDCSHAKSDAGGCGGCCSHCAAKHHTQK